MKIKKAMLMILIVTILFTMSGCLGFNYSVKISENGGSVEQAMLLSEEALAAMRELSSKNGGEATQTEAARGNRESYEIDGAKFLRFPFRTDDTDSLAALAERLNTLSLDETYIWSLEEVTSREEMENQLQEIEEEGGPVIYILRDVCIETERMGNGIILTGCIINYGSEIDEEYGETGFACTLDLKFPGTITEHTVGKKIDDTTLQINLNELWKGESDIPFTVRADLSGSCNWMVMALIVCALLGVGGIILYRKRCSSLQPQDIPEESSPETQEESEKGIENS